MATGSARWSGRERRCVNGQLFAQCFVTLFVIMDPPGTLPIFLALTANAERGRAHPRGPAGGRGRAARHRRSSRSSGRGSSPTCTSACRRCRGPAGCCCSWSRSAAHRPRRQPSPSGPRASTSRSCRSERRCWRAPARSSRPWCSPAGSTPSPTCRPSRSGVLAVHVDPVPRDALRRRHPAPARPQRGVAGHPHRRPAAVGHRRAAGRGRRARLRRGAGRERRHVRRRGVQGLLGRDAAPALPVHARPAC